MILLLRQLPLQFRRKQQRSSCSGQHQQQQQQQQQQHHQQQQQKLIKTMMAAPLNLKLLKPPTISLPRHLTATESAPPVFHWAPGGSRHPPQPPINQPITAPASEY